MDKIFIINFILEWSLSLKIILLIFVLLIFILAVTLLFYQILKKENVYLDFSIESKTKDKDFSLMRRKRIIVLTNQIESYRKCKVHLLPLEDESVKYVLYKKKKN